MYQHVPKPATARQGALSRVGWEMRLAASPMISKLRVMPSRLCRPYGARGFY